jgi:REP element-mobilizing transposase RayT
MATKPVQSAFPRSQFATKTPPKKPSFPPGTPLFITFRLHESLPEVSPAKLAELQQQPGRERQLRIEKLLDAAETGPKWLADERVAEMVCEAIEKGDKEFHRYTLHGYVVMPNHVHLLITPIHDMSVLMKELKGITARRANLILERTGKPFWASRSFDRFSRDEDNFAKMKNYIVMNPVWAKLASRPEEFRWSSARRKLATTPIAVPVMASAKTA